MKKLLAKIRKILRDRRTRRFLTRFVSGVAALIVFVTTYALVLPAITMEKEANCGIEAHQHDDSCYTEELICDIPESDGHHHDESCYSTTSALVCETEEHEHSAENGCYDDEGNLICEVMEHRHNEECYEEVRELTCRIPESEGHHHTEDCYEKVLTCGKEVHVHSTACYENDPVSESAIAASTSSAAAATTSAGSVSSAGMTLNFEGDIEKMIDADEPVDGDSVDNFGSDETNGSSVTNGTSEIASSDETNTEAASDTEVTYGRENAGTGRTETSNTALTNADNSTTALTSSADADQYIPQLDAVDFNTVLNNHTGIYYYRAADEDIVEDSSAIPAEDWNRIPNNIDRINDDMDDVELGSKDLLRVYLSYTIPAGSLNTTNPVARYRLPSNLHLTDPQVKAINENVNGLAGQYVDMSTLEITDPDKYNAYLGVEAVEGTRRPDEAVEDYLAEQVRKAGKDADDAAEYISAVVRVENVYDADGLYGEKDAYLGQDLIFTFAPYSIEKNQHEYDSTGKPTKAGEEIKGWFTFDLNMGQVDFEEPEITTSTAGETSNIEDNVEGDSESSPSEDENTEENHTENVQPEDDHSEENPTKEVSIEDGHKDESNEENHSVNNTTVDDNTADNESSEDGKADDNQDHAVTIERAERTAEIIFVEEEWDGKDKKTDQISTTLTAVEETVLEAQNDDKLEDDEDPPVSGEKERLEEENEGALSDEATADGNVKDPVDTEQVIMPAMSFNDSIKVSTGKPAGIDQNTGSFLANAAESLPEEAEVSVRVEADEGTFPAGTTMVLSAVDQSYNALASTIVETLENGDTSAIETYGPKMDGQQGKTKKNKEQKTGLDNVTVKTYGFQAVDITFFNKDGNEIKPAKPVRVTLTSSIVEQARKEKENSAVAEPVVVHVDNDGKAEIIDLIDPEETQPAIGRNEEELLEEIEKTSKASSEEPVKQMDNIDQKDDAEESRGEDQQPALNADQSTEDKFDSGEVIKDSNEIIDGSVDDSTVSFETNAFSIYAIVYTVDFRWEVDGKMYEFSIPGGGFVTLQQLVEVLGIVNSDTYSETASNDEGKSGEFSKEDEEAQNESGQSTDSDSEASENNGPLAERVLTLSNVQISNQTKEFVAGIDNVEFSNPELIWVGKTSQDSTVGGLKSANGIDCQYSAYLTEEQIAEINAQTVQAGDWALISMQPFMSTETLTVSMKTGDVFTVKVTDAQATDPLGLDKQTFVIANGGNAMKAEVDTAGQLESHAVNNDLGDLYNWKFLYDATVFESTGGYYLTSNEQYIKVDEANYISLVDDISEATPFKVQFDSNQLETDTHEKGKYRLSTTANSASIFLNCQYSKFGIAASSADTCWMELRSPVTPQSDAGYVATWDIIGDGIVLKMFDYSGQVNNKDIDAQGQWGNSISESSYRSGWGINNNRGLIFSGSGLSGLNGSTVDKLNQFTGEWNQSNNAQVYNKMANQGIVKQTLNAAGYPVLQNQYWKTNDTRDQGSLGYLFGAGGQDGVTPYTGTDGKGLQGLLRKDAQGYYYYDSEWNYARMNADNTEILLYSDTYKKDKETDGHERKEKIGFFPFTDYNTSKREEKGPQQQYYDHQFGTSMHTDFFYPTRGIDPETNLPMRFEFSGDDDVWVFVDGVLVLDLGGVHQPVRGVVDFSEGKTYIYEYDYNGNEIVTEKTFAQLFAGSGKTFSTTNMSKHSLDFFYLERGGCDSNCAIKFNLLVTKTLYLQKEIQGLDLLPEEERAQYKDMVFNLELNMRDPSEGSSIPYSLYNTADPDNTDTAVNYTTRYDADGNILEQGFPIKNGQITIKDGQTVAIAKLPPSIQYYVSEEKTTVLERFSKPLAKNKKGSSLKLENKKSVYDNTLYTWKTPNQTLKSNDTVKFINRIPETNLDVVKEWKDIPPVDHTEDTVNFTVSATVPGEGEGAAPVPYPVAAIDGITFTLSASENWRKAINHLPDKTPDGRQITYTVKEEPVNGYISAVIVTPGPEDADDKRVEHKIENTPFQIKVKKNWIGEWPAEDKAKVDPITVTLKRFKLQDKENLIIRSGYEVIMPGDMTANDFVYRADYQVLDSENNVVAEVSSAGEDIILSLPDGTYTVVQTTTDPESGYDVAHSPESRTISGLNVTANAQTAADFSSTYTRHTGTLTVTSTVTDETGTFDAVYIVYDENDQEVGRATYTEARTGKSFTLPTGTYHVAESVITNPTSSTLRSQSVDPAGAAQTLAKDDEKSVDFTRVYERIIDSNNTFEIHHLFQYGGNTLASGSIPANYPAGTTIRLSFECYNGGWTSRNQSAQYNNSSTDVSARTLQNGHAEFSVQYTLIQNGSMVIQLNAQPGSGNAYVPNSVRIDVVSWPNSTNAGPNASPNSRLMMSARKAPGPLRSAYVTYARRELTNTAADPVPADDTKKYVRDNWSREVQLTAADNWETLVKGLEVCDENGNLYYYFIDSAVEPDLRTDAEAVIDKNGEEKLVVYKENRDTPLTLSNTVYPGSLMLTKVVQVNGLEPTEGNASLTDGTYEFLIQSVAGSTATSVSHTVKITFRNGKAVTQQIDDQEETAVSGTDNTWGVLVPNLPVGDYTVTETSSGNLTLISVTGGSSVSNNVATLTVTSQETVPGAKAQAVFTNNVNTTALNVQKVWADEDSVDHSGDSIEYSLNRIPYYMVMNDVTGQAERRDFDPEQVTTQLVPAMYGFTGSLSSTNNWMERIDRLPQTGNHNGTQVSYDYYVSEGVYHIQDPPEGQDPIRYRPSVEPIVIAEGEHQGETLYLITNEPMGETDRETDIDVEKKWQYADGTADNRLHKDDSIKFNVIQKKYYAKVRINVGGHTEERMLYPIIVDLVDKGGDPNAPRVHHKTIVYVPDGADFTLRPHYTTTNEQRHTVRPIGIAPLEGVEYNTTTQPNEPPSNVYYYSGTEFKINNVDSAKEVTLWLYSGYDVWNALYDRADYTDGNPPPAPDYRKWTCDMFSTQGIIWELNEMLDNVLNGETFPEDTKPDPVGTSTFDYSMSLTTTSETGLPTVITRVSGQGIGAGSQEESWKGTIKDLIAYEYIPDEDDPNLGGDSYIYSYEVQETSIRTGAEADPDSVEVYDEPVTGEDGQRWDGESTLYYARWDETDADSWTITNRRKDEIDAAIHKVDKRDLNEETFIPLEGAEFKLVKYKLIGSGQGESSGEGSSGETGDDLGSGNECHWVKDTDWGNNGEMDISEDPETPGVFKLGKLERGYYKIVETKFPNGYIKPAEDPMFLVRWNENHLMEAILVHASGENMGEIIESNATDQVKIGNENENATVTCGNEPGAELPHTGGPGTKMIYLLGVILTIASVLLLIRKRIRE